MTSRNASQHQRDEWLRANESRLKSESLTEIAKAMKSERIYSKRTDIRNITSSIVNRCLKLNLPVPSKP